MDKMKARTKDDKKSSIEYHQAQDTDHGNTSEFDEENDPFQFVMERAGIQGRFQFIYKLIFVTALSMAGSMIYMNIILALNVPDHWCTVPGREKTNYTLDEWRNITLPMHRNNRGVEKYSKCEMFAVNLTDIDDGQNWSLTIDPTKVTVCQNGWSYDKTWYESTIPTQEDWVCTKDLFVTNVFIIGRIAEVAGSFVLGQLGDTFGRRVVYYISVVFTALGRTLSIIAVSSFTWFLILSCITAFTVNILFQSPSIVGMEISREEERSTIVMYQSVGWSIGTTLMPLLYWWLGEWQPFMWLTSLPTAIILLFSSFFIESPRWLISKKRFADAIKQFKKIAKINGRNFDMTEKELAKMFSTQKEETTYGIASLFSGYRLARNTTIIGFSWCVVAVSYFTLVLFSSRMGGNPFLNFLLQSVVEIPAYSVGKYLGDTLGRRFTNTTSFFVSFLTCLPIIIYAPDEKYEILIMGLAAFIKFLNAVTYFTSSLQGMEIYPTCVRQTGIALGTILANIVGVVAPYLVYLGTTVDIRCPYYILGTLFLLGAIGAAFVPETLHKKLPDSMEEARQFGKNSKFFSLPKAPRGNSDLAAADNAVEIVEKLNQNTYVP